MCCQLYLRIFLLKSVIVVSMATVAINMCFRFQHRNDKVLLPGASLQYWWIGILRLYRWKLCFEDATLVPCEISILGLERSIKVGRKGSRTINRRSPLGRLVASLGEA